MNDGPARLTTRLQALAITDTSVLRVEWARLHRTAPPPRLSRDLLIRGIADKLQEAALGGLPAAFRRRLATWASASQDSAAAARTLPPARLRPGTRLLRSWHGHTFSVTALADGFAFEDRHYASLTEIATTITGTHWSGPRFFGLSKAPRSHSRAEAGTSDDAGAAAINGMADADAG